MNKVEIAFLYAFFLSMVLLPFQFGRIWIGDLYIPYGIFIIIALLYLIVSKKMLQQRLKLVIPIFYIVLALTFIFAIFLSTIGSHGFQFDRVMEYIFYLLVPIIIINTIRDIKQLRRSIYILFLVGVIFMSIGYYRLIMLHASWFSLSPPHAGVGTRNSDVFMMEGILMLMLSYVLYSKRKRTHILIFALSISMLVTIALSLSRGSWLSTLFGLLMLFFSSTKAKTKIGLKLFALLSIVLILSSMIIPSSYIENLKSRAMTLVSSELTSSIDIRKSLITQTLTVIGEHPIKGIGIGNFTKYVDVRTRAGLQESHPHNAYLYVWIEEGVLGLIPFLALLFIPLMKLFRIKNHISDDQRWITVGLFAALGVYAFHFLFSTLFNFIFFWIIYGLGTTTILLVEKGSVKKLALERH